MDCDSPLQRGNQEIVWGGGGVVIWTENVFLKHETMLLILPNVFLFKIRVCTSVLVGLINCNLIGMWE